MAENKIHTGSAGIAELTDGNLDGIAGGYVFFNGEAYEVIDEKGDVVRTVWGDTLNERLRAAQYARDLGLSDHEIFWRDLDALRKKNQ